MNMPLSVCLSVCLLGVPAIGRVIVMKVSEARWVGALEHLFLIIRQAILELRARPVAPLALPTRFWVRQRPIPGAGGWLQVWEPEPGARVVGRHSGCRRRRHSR